MAYHNGPRVVTNGLVLALDVANPKSYVSGSITWNDLSGNQNVGTLVNGPTYNGANGGSIVFDGTNDYVSVADNTSLNFGTGDFTVLVWISGISAYPGSGKTIIRKGGRFDANLAGWSMTWAGSPTDIYFIVGSSSSRLEGRCFPNNSLNGWVGHKMIGMQRNGTSWNQIVDTTVTNLGTFSGDVSNTSVIEIAYNSVYGTYLNNNVASIFVYNRALSANEIIQNFNAARGRFGI